MNYRSSEILAAESIATVGTKTIDLNLRDPISRLSIQVKLTGNGDEPHAHPAKSISKIELVDGSNVVFSMKGIAAQALDFYDTGIEPHNALAYHNDVQAIALFNLNFGRFLFDPELALDPKKFNNLQLKISHDLANGGCHPDAAEMRIRADVFDEKVPSLRGFLCSKEHYGYALIVNGVEYVDLPTDFAIRKLLLQTYADTKAPFEQINQIKLSEDHDKRVVYEGYQSDFIKHLVGLWPLYRELLYGVTSGTAVLFFITPALWPYYALMSDDATAAALYGDFTSGCRQSIKASAATPFRGVVQGFCPHGAVAYPFGIQSDLTDWWDVTRLGSVQLKLTAGSSIEASSTAEIITQQLRPY